MAWVRGDPWVRSDPWAEHDSGGATGPVVTATPISTTRIDLSWPAYPGANGYDVERNGVQILTHYQGTAYSDTGLTASTEYTYRVGAVT